MIPFIFLYNTELLCFDSATATFALTPSVILCVVTALIGCAFMALSLFGWMGRDLKVPERLVLLACGVCLMLKDPAILNLVGLIVGGGILAVAVISGKKKEGQLQC